MVMSGSNLSTSEQNWSLMDDWALEISPRNRGAVVLDRLKEEFWRWYAVHENDVILKKKILLFTVGIHARDLRPLFEVIFGKRPEG